MTNKCIVHGCLNHKHQGIFTGDLCMPCHNMLTSGEVKYGETFIHGLRDRIDSLTAERDALAEKLAKAVEALESIVRDCEADYPPSHGAIKHFARATLAKITGEPR